MMPDRTRRCFGIALFASALSVIAAVVAMWPTPGRDQSVTVLCGTRSMPREVDLLVLVLLFGALGSFVHVAKSFASFAGNRALVASWLWWYLLQPVAGMALALLFYPAFPAWSACFPNRPPTSSANCSAPCSGPLPTPSATTSSPHPQPDISAAGPEPESVVWSPSCHRIPI